MPADLAVTIGEIRLKNPLICGAGEHLMEEAGLRRAIAAGAGAVVIKSTNESAAARRQLLQSEYALLDSHWTRLSKESQNLGGRNLADMSLLCRSGLAQQPFDEWLDLAARMDRLAASHDAYVVASLIPADVAQTIAYARQIEAAGLRILEVNIGAPHGGEALPGAILLERSAERVAAITKAVRQAVKIPLWIKLTGQAQNIPELALAARQGGADAVTVMGRLMGFLPDIETCKPVLNTHGAYGGPWALPLSCHWLAKTREKTGAAFPLIGTNGARNGLDIVRFILAGASAVQITSAVITGGFEVITQSLDELRGYLERRGVGIADLVGLAADRAQSYGDQPMAPENWKAFVPQESLD